MKKKLRMICAVMVMAIMPFATYAQLSGSYTIDGATATGGTNYQTFTAAVSALSSQGVSGAVTFNVASGTYTEQISIPAISGASTTNTVTFKGLGDLTTITAAPTLANLPIISLDSASHISIDSLKIEVTGTMGWGVHFMRHADTNEIANCHIVGPALSSTRGIISSGSTTAISVVQNNAEYILIQNNTIDGFGVSVNMVGKTGPLTTPNKQINYGTDISVVGNTILDFTGKAVIINHYHNVNIEANEISTSNTACNGALSFWDAGDNMTITRNNVYINSNANNTRLIVLAMAPGNGPAGDATKPAIIANNMIQYEGTNTTRPTVLLMKNKDNIKVYNNSFKIKNQGTDANCIWFDNNNARTLSGIEVRNNIFVLENSGSGQFFYCGSSTIGSRFSTMVIDHNNYFAPSGYFKSIVPDGSGLSTYNSFSDYTVNTNGWGTGALNVDPGFAAVRNLHATSGQMSDLGAVIPAVTIDIDGDVRSATTPDIGADEYTAPTCITSDKLGVLNILSTSVDVFWYTYNTGASYKVQYGAPGFVLGSGTTVLATNDTVALTGLTMQTDYEFYVIDVCSATDSSYWAGPYAFSTACATVVTFPYTENFDGSTWASGTGGANSGAVIDPCWTATPDNSSTSFYRWGTRTGASSSSGTGPSSDVSGTGNYIFTESSYGSSGDVAEFVSPNFDLTVLSKPQLEFQYHMLGSGMGDLRVAIRGNGIEDTLLTQTANNNSWEEVTISLTGYSGVYSIVFYAEKGTSVASDMAIDEFKVSEEPLCAKATLVYFDNETPSSVDLNFTSSGSKFIIEYGPKGFVQGTGLVDTALASGHTINGLASGKTYDFYIRTDCSSSMNGLSTWAGPFTSSTLCSVFTSFPHLESFYGNDWVAGSGVYNDGDTLNGCWSRTPEVATFFRWNVGTGSTSSGSTGPSTDVTGAENYIFTEGSSGSAGDIAMIASPQFDLSQLNQPQLIFDYHMYGANMGSLYVEITNGTFTDTLFMESGNKGDQWNNVVINIDSTLNGIYSFNFIGVRGTGLTSDMAFDQFTLIEAPACLPPTLFISGNITPSGFDAFWGGGNSSTYDLEYLPSGFAQGTGTVITGINDTTYALTNLAANTCYDVYVRSNCTGLTSTWLGPITVCTACNIAVAPFSENFDAAPWKSGIGGLSANDTIGDCWSRTPFNSGDFKWSVRTGTTSSSNTGPNADVSGTGNYMYTESSNGSSNDVAYLELPTIDFSGLTTPTLIFDYHMFGATMGELFVTIYNGTKWDTIFTISGQQQMTSAEAFTKVTVDLSTYKTSPRQIRIGGTRGISLTSDMAIDEVKVDEMPTCLLPTSFTIGNVFVNTADFSWTTPTGSTSFIVEYGLTGFTQGSGLTNKAYFNSTSGTISGLAGNTTYDAYLADACDSTVWVGPITFTTFIDYDAKMNGLVSTQTSYCGDSNYVVEVSVENIGLQPITSLDVYVDVTGATTANINTTYTGTIASGATANITVGTFNSYNGGTYNFKAYTALTNDQDLSNDTLNANNVVVFAAEPLHMPIDTICANDTAGYFVAIPQTGITHNWYANANDNVPVHVGDTLTVPTSGQKTWYLDRNKDNTVEIQNGTQGSAYGTMFKFYVKQDFKFTGYTWVSHLTGSKSIKAFYKIGTYRGHETTRSSWTLIDSVEVASTSSMQSIRFDFATPVIFTAGDTVSIYLASKTGKYESEGLTGAAIDDVFKSNSDFDYLAGVSGAYFGGNLVTASSANSITCDLHWSSLDVCGNKRIPLTLEINNDTAMADFTAAVNANGADVDFDASASTGQVYNWNFGDGNTGTGIMTTNTYASGGSYSVTLTVTDTVCNTIDTLTKTVLATVGIEQDLLSRTLNLFPNPNNGTFRVEFEMEGVKHVNLSIVNMVGQSLYTEDMGNCAGHVQKNVMLTNLASGMYFVRVEADGSTATLKFNVQ